MYEKVTRQFRQCETSGMRNSNLVLGQNFFECLSPYYFYFIFFFFTGGLSYYRPNQPACFCILDCCTDQHIRCLIQPRGPATMGIWQSVELKENAVEKPHASLSCEKHEWAEVTFSFKM